MIDVEHAWATHTPGVVAPTDDDLTADGSLTRRWRRMWDTHPTAAQVQDVDGTWTGTDELEARTRAVAAGLLAGGLEPGDRVVLSAERSLGFVLAYVALLRAGLTVVPVDTRTPRDALVRVLHTTRASAAVMDTGERAAWVATDAAAPLPTWDVAALPTAADRDVLDAAGTDDPAVLISTSGTTGAPKGVALTHGNLLASATAVATAWRWAPDDRLLLTLPLFHVHGLGVGINGTLGVGASVSLRPGFDADDVTARLRDRAASLFFGVPTMYRRLAAAGDAAALARARLLVSGSAPLAADLAERIRAFAGQVPLERYGMTETVMLTGNPHDGERRPGTVGLPFPGVHLRLDPEQGEVEVRGPNVIRSYVDGVGAEAFTADGWFRTGDLAELDDAGYLRIVGRAKELIITGGSNVLPREVEEVLARHPAIDEVAVVGRPDDEWGEVVTACVVSDAPPGLDELRAFAAEALPPHKLPRALHRVEAIPRNALGKVVRDQLAAEVVRSDPSL